MRLIALAILVSLFSSPGPAHSGNPAFPGAFGFGSKATGWRWGDVLTVTNLDDSGPGSLRACVEREGPRICVFAVSGTIDLDTELKIAPNVYVAGQTAPGDGIQLRLRDSFRSPLVLLDTHDVVVRHLKVRPGPGRGTTPAVDGITLENAERVYIDHVSIMFASDENLNVHVSGGTSADITVANSIIAFGLENSNHPNGRHSKGALICSSEAENNACGRITLARNLFANNRDRNPDLKATDIGGIEVVNNLFYNFGSQAGEFYNLLGNLRVNYVGNTAIAGPSTMDERPQMIQAFLMHESNGLEIYEEDNLALECGSEARNAVLDDVAMEARVDSPVGPLVSPVLPAHEGLAWVLANAGDRIPGRRSPDALDALVALHVQSCGGMIIDSVEELGGWPEIPAAEAAPDADGDGLPDQWEMARPWLDPNDPEDTWSTFPGTNLPSIEVYLAERAGDL